MRRPTYSQVVSTLALFVALGGTAYAASLPTGSVGSAQLRRNAVTAPKLAAGAVRARAVARDALTGGQIAEATLGTVPRAAVAASAGDAARLGGQPAASYRLGCPEGLIATHGLCVESDVRPGAGFRAALQTCVAAGRRLPTISEAAQSFNVLDASQPIQWTSDLTWDASEATPRLLAMLLSSDESRTPSINPGGLTLVAPYRCVGSASN